MVFSYELCENFSELFFPENNLYLKWVKRVRIRRFSGLSFPTFELNTKKYSVEILRISPYSVRMREKTDQKNSRTVFTLCRSICEIRYSSQYLTESLYKEGQNIQSLLERLQHLGENYHFCSGDEFYKKS